MMSMRVGPLGAMLALSGAVQGCSAATEKGSAKFTTWGEDYIESGIRSDPAGETGFIDDWTLRYRKFLVVFHAITVADSDGRTGAAMTGSRFVDNVVAGRKELVSFPELDARAWDRVSYQIKPARPDSVVIAGDAADRDMMATNGYSVYVEGEATKLGDAGVTMSFHWGFTTATQYSHCQGEESGKLTEGIVVTNGGTNTSELTTHGDHLFYDRLQASDDPTNRTALRFEEKAAADAPPNGNGDREITLEELSKQLIDVKKYDPSGFNAPTLGAFMTALARTIGHFRGEGECEISEAAP